METTLKTILIILIWFFAILTGALLTGWLVIHRFNGNLISHGVKRRYILHVPASYDPSTPAPLVISMHGFGDWPAHQMQMSGWNDLADEECFIVVYPMGTRFPLRWKLYDFENPAGNPTADIHFISDLVNHLEQQYNIDPLRIYANGLSNGGGMAQALSCALSERIAAVGCVSGAYVYPLNACQSTRPVPVIAFHGTADAIVPYQGGPSERFPLPFPCIPEFMEKLAQRNGCTATPIEQTISPNVHSISYTGCNANADVVFYSIQGGGHSWPGGKAMPRTIVGETNHEINATRLIWDFFKEHSLLKD
jgi:polyhydroxybutyrate depolymerase